MKESLENFIQSDQQAAKIGQAVVSYVWFEHLPYVSWAGGSEVYTIGQMEALRRRGIPSQIITTNDMTAESFARYPDIPILNLPDKDSLADLDDRLMFMFHPPQQATKHPYVYLHTPIKCATHDDSWAFAEGLRGAEPITTSRFMSEYWAQVLNLEKKPAVVYPFVDKVFSEVERPDRNNGVSKILFAGRPTQDKGVYTLLASLHMPQMREANFELSCIKTVNHAGGSDIINTIYDNHPQITALEPQTSRSEMAELFAAHDVVVMPSSSVLWKEAFGMISAEAQHAGCRVVTSNDGGLPETDCGGLLLVEPDNPSTLAQGIRDAMDQGPLTEQERARAATYYTEEQSVDSLLRTIT